VWLSLWLNIPEVSDVGAAGTMALGKRFLSLGLGGMIRSTSSCA
jgi:hypothetical protein